MTDLYEIENITIDEYNLRMKAANLKRLDQEYLIHLAAWKHNEVTAQRKIGKDKTEPYFKKFDAFFNYTKREEELLGSKAENKKLSMLMKINQNIKERRR